MNRNENKSNYVSLAPRNERKDEYQEYYNALDFAFGEESIRNIAVTGSYASGKSSIINSYFNDCSIKEAKPINISLANFDASISETELEDEVLKLLFYSIDGRRLKSSQYQKITGRLKFKDFIFPFFFAFSSIMIIGIINAVKRIVDFLANDTDSLEKILTTFTERVSFIVMIAILIVIVFIVLLYVFVRGIMIYYNKLSPFLKSLMIKDLKLEECNNNIFDRNIHEIVNMMIDIEENVFIFEDLDRYKDKSHNSIYIKLRNLNILINNNEIIKKKMSKNKVIKCKKFIYVLKDDLDCVIDNNSNTENIVNEQRTKFFDFIIPIIPMTTQNNITVEFSNVIKECGISEMDRDFINKICIYINSRRDINNIVNEFSVYKRTLENVNISFDNKELMALIVYKNINPKKFAMLQEKDSLNGIFKEINRTRIELLNKYIEEKNTIEKKQHPYLTDADIKRKDDLEVKICALKGNDKGIYRENRIISILNDKELDEFVIMAIKNKYIDNNYYNYINYFYEGQLTLNDRQYVKIVNLKGEPDKEYQIENPSNVYDYLDENDYVDKSILNYSLIKYAINSELKNIKTCSLIKVIVKEYGLKEISNIIEYIGNNVQDEEVDSTISMFLNLCFEVDNEVFENIDDERVISKGEQFDIANKIILLMLPEQIKIIDKNKKLTKIVSTNVKLISELDEEKQNVYLNNIDFDCSLIKCDYDDKVGILSKKIVKKKIDNKEPVGYYNLLENYFKHEKKENFNNNEFVNNNYDYICDSGDNDLISNIKNNIDSYTENCLLKTGAAKIEFTDKILVLLYWLKNEKNVEVIISKMGGEYDIAQFDYEINDEEQQYRIKRRKFIYNNIIKNCNINLKLESLYKYYKLCGWNDGIVEYASKKIRYLQENKNLEIQDESSGFCADLLMECENIDGVEMLIGNQRINLQAGQFNALSDKTKNYLINHNNLNYNTVLIQPIKSISNKHLIIYLINNINDYLKRHLDYDLSVIDIEEMIKLDKMNDEQTFQLVNLKVTGSKVIERNGKIEKFIISSKKAFNQNVMEKVMNNLSFNDKIAMLLNKIDTIENSLLIYLLRYNGGLFKEYVVNGTQNLYCINIDALKKNRIKKFLDKLIGKSIIRVQKSEDDNIIFEL